MKWMIFHWKMFLLRREYEKRLDRITKERFTHCKLGTMTKQRKIVHVWYANRSIELYAKYR